MVLAEQLSALSAIDLAIGRVQSFFAERLRTNIIRPRLLPMRPRHHLVRVNPWRFRGSYWGRGADSRWNCRSRRNIVRFKHLQALQLLIEDREGLELLGLDHLGLEPILDFILFDFFEVLVGIVEMSRED